MLEDVLPAVKSAVDIEKIKWMLTLWAGVYLFVTCPAEDARHTIYIDRHESYLLKTKREISMSVLFQY